MSKILSESIREMLSKRGILTILSVILLSSSFSPFQGCVLGMIFLVIVLYIDSVKADLEEKIKNKSDL